MIGAGAARLDFARCIHEIGRGHAARALAEPEARALGEAMLEGEVPPLELGAILLAYRLKGETLEELVGFMDALAPRVAPFAPAQNGVRPVILPSYNGARRLPNLTALLALSLRRHVPVLLHGSDHAGASGRVTTAAVLRELGFDAATSLDDAKARLRRDGLAFVPTEVLSPALATLLSLRERMGVRSVAHTLAKLIEVEGREIRIVDPSRLRAYHG